MTNTESIALLPVDNRPVSYLLPKQIADFSGINLILPKRKYLGDLNEGSDLEYLEKWCRSLTNQIPTLIIALDNWVYGGLVQSRKHSLPLPELKKRVEALHATPLQNIYGFSSIMRIADIYSDEEEKEYWKEHGKKIFKWSELMYKVGRGIKDEGTTYEELIEKWYQSTKKIPQEVLADYKGLRDKNFTVNSIWLDSLHSNLFKYLIFSCDDSPKYGMNIVEAEYLEKQIKIHNFSQLAKVVPGTDEIPLLLLAKANLKSSDIKPVLSLYFNSEKGKNENARYESKSIENSVLNQISVLGLKTGLVEESDIVVCIHLADTKQGDHVFGEKPTGTKENAKLILDKVNGFKKPFILIDLAYANGADPNLIELFLKSNVNLKNLYGFSGWNTCSNSIGSALSIGINRWIAEKSNRFDEYNFKRCLLVRFLDDYVYQTKIRHLTIKEDKLNDKMKSYVRDVSRFLGLDEVDFRCKLPWKRSFEIEIELADVVQTKNTRRN